MKPFILHIRLFKSQQGNLSVSILILLSALVLLVVIWGGYRLVTHRSVQLDHDYFLVKQIAQLAKNQEIIKLDDVSLFENIDTQWNSFQYMGANVTVENQFVSTQERAIKVSVQSGDIQYEKEYVFNRQHQLSQFVSLIGISYDELLFELTVTLKNHSSLPIQVNHVQAGYKGYRTGHLINKVVYEGKESIGPFTIQLIPLTDVVVPSNAQYIFTFQFSKNMTDKYGDFFFYLADGSVKSVSFDMR